MHSASGFINREKQGKEQRDEDDDQVEGEEGITFPSR